MINKVDHTTFTRVPSSFLINCEAKDPPKSLEKSSLEPTAPSTTSSWVAVLDFFLSIFSWIKDNLCCCLFDEDEETRERKIDQLRQFTALYVDPNLTQDKFIEIFNGLDAELQKQIKDRMPRVIRSCFVGVTQKPTKEQVNDLIESILTSTSISKSILTPGCKFELDTGKPPPHDKILVFGEALKAVLNKLSRIEPT